MGLVKERIIAVQDQALGTKNMRNKVFNEDVSPMCRLCAGKEETVAHVASECARLVRIEYKKTRHHNVARIIHRKLCKK